MKTRNIMIGGGIAAGIFALLSSSKKSAPPVKPSNQTRPRLSDQFFSDVHTLARTLHDRGAMLTSQDIMSVFLSESGVNPASRNALGYAGINGMGSEERKALGFNGTIDDWCALSAEEQLPYVQKYIERDIASFAGGNYRVLNSAGRLYLLNFTPAFVNKPDSFVIARKGSAIYDQNTGIDVDKKGYIEVADMNRFLALRLKQSAALWGELVLRLAQTGPAIT